MCVYVLIFPYSYSPHFTQNDRHAHLNILSLSDGFSYLYTQEMNDVCNYDINWMTDPIDNKFAQMWMKAIYKMILQNCIATQLSFNQPTNIRKCHFQHTLVTDISIDFFSDNAQCDKRNNIYKNHYAHTQNVNTYTCRDIYKVVYACVCLYVCCVGVTGAKIGISITSRNSGWGYYVHFLTYTLGKDMNPFILQTYGLNSSILSFLNLDGNHSRSNKSPI